MSLQIVVVGKSLLAMWAHVGTKFEVAAFVVIHDFAFTFEFHVTFLAWIRT